MDSRETIYNTLFALVQTSASFVTASRRLRHWSELDPAEQPAVFQVQRGEEIMQQKGLPPKQKLAAQLYVYSYLDDANTSPSTLLNPLIDSIMALFTPDTTTGFFTMGLDSVSHAWVEGNIETDEGLFGAQAWAIIPISILAT